LLPSRCDFRRQDSRKGAKPTCRPSGRNSLQSLIAGIEPAKTAQQHRSHRSSSECMGLCVRGDLKLHLVSGSSNCFAPQKTDEEKIHVPSAIFGQLCSSAVGSYTHAREQAGESLHSHSFLDSYALLSAMCRRCGECVRQDAEPKVFLGWIEGGELYPSRSIEQIKNSFRSGIPLSLLRVDLVR